MNVYLFEQILYKINAVSQYTRINHYPTAPA